MVPAGAVLCGPAPVCPSWSFSLPWCPKSPSPNFRISQGQGPGSRILHPRHRWAQLGSLSWCLGLPVGPTLPAVLTHLGEHQRLLQRGRVLSLAGVSEARTETPQFPSQLCSWLCRPGTSIFYRNTQSRTWVASRPPYCTVMTLNKLFLTLWVLFSHLNQEGSQLDDCSLPRWVPSGPNRSPCTALLPRRLLQE